MLRLIKQWINRRRIAACSHPVPWIVLERSNRIWWRNIFSLEFYIGDVPPSAHPLADGWCHARRLKCKKCGGTFDEITLGERWLNAKREGQFISSFSVDKMLKGCGSIPDSRYRL